MTFLLDIPHRWVDPQHRVKRLFTAAGDGAMSDDPLEDALLRFLRGEPDTPREIQLAAHMFNDLRWRNAIEALLLAGGDVNDLHNLLEIDPIVAAVYTRFFFDVSVFEHYPDRWNYVHTHPDRETKDEPGFLFKEAALDKGIEYLRPALRLDRGIATNEQAMVRGLTLAYMRVCDDARSNSVHRTEEARKWAEVMVKMMQASAEAKAEVGPSVEELVVELKREIVERVIEGEILH